MIFYPKPCRRLNGTLIAAVALGALSACAPKVGEQQPRPATIQPIHNAQQMDDVIDILEKGDEKAARKVLRQMVKRNAADADAALLLESLTADPVTLLGAKNFQYRVQPGERLPALAQRFLGTRLKFYALARYNDIKIPAQLASGQVIRIPGDAPPPPPLATPRTRPAPVRESPAKPAPAPPAARSKAPAQNSAQAAKLRSAGLTALNQGQVSRAVVLLGQASSLDPANALIQRDLQRAMRIRKTVKGKR